MGKHTQILKSQSSWGAYKRLQHHFDQNAFHKPL